MDKKINLYMNEIKNWNNLKNLNFFVITNNKLLLLLFYYYSFLNKREREREREREKKWTTQK